MKRLLLSLAFSVLSVALVTPQAHATELVTELDFLWDVQDGLGGAFGRDGTIGDGGTGAGTRFDSYDGGFRLNVNGTAYAPTGPGTASGRTITTPIVVISGLNVSRLIYVPATGGNWVRYVEIVDNPTAAPVMATILVDVNLGSDGGESVTGSSSGDTTVTPADSWFGTDSATDGDLALTFVIQANEPTVRASTATRTSGAVSFSFATMVPAGGRVAVMHFGLQRNTPAEGVTEAMTILSEPDAIYTGLDTIRDAIINWGVRTGTCVGADGSACTVGTDAGRCYGGVCCPGCWDAAAMRCRSGRGASACARGGAACVSCSDDDLCTSDVCTAGVCSNPNAPSGTSCDDGAFCTATDRCDGSGSCLGTGTPCDDMQSCTTDSCSEAARTCMNVLMAGVCNIASTCVPSGTPNPTNPCEVCDATRSTTAYSPVATGTTCGVERCSAGRYFPAGACSAAGSCEVPPVIDCPSGTCTGTVCTGACTATSCASGEYCSTRTLMCEPLIAAGSPCSFSATCASGFCVDNVCCESDCGGMCERCGSTGLCSAVPNGGDPDRECAGDDVCDGTGMCRPATMVDAGTDAPMMMMPDVPPLDAAVDAPEPMDTGVPDVIIMRPDVPLPGADTAPPTARGCACAASRNESPGLFGLLGLGLVWVLRRRR